LNKCPKLIFTVGRAHHQRQIINSPRMINGYNLPNTLKGFVLRVLNLKQELMLFKRPLCWNTKLRWLILTQAWSGFSSVSIRLNQTGN